MAKFYNQYSLMKSSSQKAIAVGNIFAFIIMIAANCLSLFIPLNGKSTNATERSVPKFIYTCRL